MNRNKGKRIVIVILAVLLSAAAVLGGYVWYDNNVDRSGWEEKDGQRYYRDFYGDRVSGWLDIDGERCYFSDDGELQTLWQQIDGSQYFFGTDGKMAVGLQRIDGLQYCFDPDGRMVTGWREIDGQRNYFGTDGVMVSGWVELEGKRYYLDENGAAVTGSFSLDGKQYYFLEDGSAQIGWMDQQYYLSDGALAVGWQDIDGCRFYFDEAGQMRTGWLEQGEYSYFLKEDGVMAVGPNVIDGKTYYFSPNGVHLWLVNPWNELHEDYAVELEQVVAGYRVATSCKDALNQMLEDCTAAGLLPELISGYRSYWDQYALYMEKIAEYGVAYGSQIVAKPNTSEHQLGLAVDIVASGNYTLNKSQESNRVQKWLMEHCWEYGFIVRYPEGTTDITGIIYEPWHYRYVGVEVALELKELGITLEEYLGAVNAA